MDSIIQDKKKCFVVGCKHTDLEEHHIFMGALRKISEKWGLKVWLCGEHHRGDYSPHKDDEFNRDLKALAQRIFLIDHTEAEWMDTKKGIGRNFLK